MNVVIPFHNGDAHLAIDLVKWIGQLGGIGEGKMFLICDSGINPDAAAAIAKASEFKAIGLSNWPAVNGWPQGSNSLFRMALNVSTGSARNSWLWLEPDAIPLKAGWLDAIRKEYAACGKRYMGNVYVCNNPRLPNRLMSGIGVYPADAKNDLLHFTKTHLAWDVEAARFLVENCHHTKLIHHFWGIAGMPPTFAAARTDSSKPNTFTLESIHKDAVIFHRNKDGTLLELLKQLIPTFIETPAFIPPEPTGRKIDSILGPDNAPIKTVSMPEFETLPPIKNDAELIAKIRDSVTDW